MPTITFSGLGSGLDTASWVEALVSVKQTTITSLQSKKSTIEAKQATVSKLQSSFSSLRMSIEKLTDAKFGGALDLFANNNATSSDEKIFTARATQSAARMSYNIRVEQLATKTSVGAKGTVSAVADDETMLSSLGIKEGSVTVFVNGKKTTVDISDNDTVQDLKARFSTAGARLEVLDDGKLSISAVNAGDKVLVGATNDKSNFKSVLGLELQEDGSYLSNTALYKAAGASTIMDSGLFAKTNEDGTVERLTVTAGTFTIGNAEFTIDSNTTINDLISKINRNEDAQATAYWDSANAKLVLNSNIEGQSYVNIEAGTSNFTDVMQFTTSEWDEDGNLVSTALNVDNQKLGDNAILYVNGSKVTSSSNIVTSDISRLDGVTLTLKGLSTEESGETTLKVEQDTSSLIDAVSDFVDKYNEIIKSLDDLTKTSGDLYGDTALNSLKRSLRGLATSSNGGDGVYTLLNQIGISTATAGAGISDDTNKLTLDKDMLKKALEESSDGVKALMMGTGGNGDGLLSKMESLVEDAVGAQGYFSTITKSLKSEVSNYEERINTQTTRIANYKARLESQFSAMEKTISSMQQAYSSYLGQ